MNLGDKQGEMVVLEPLDATPAPVEIAHQTPREPVKATAASLAESAEAERNAHATFVEA